MRELEAYFRERRLAMDAKTTDPMVALFFLLLREIPADKIERVFQKIEISNRERLEAQEPWVLGSQGMADYAKTFADRMQAIRDEISKKVGVVLSTMISDIVQIRAEHLASAFFGQPAQSISKGKMAIVFSLCEASLKNKASDEEILAILKDAFHDDTLAILKGACLEAPAGSKAP